MPEIPQEEIDRWESQRDQLTADLAAANSSLERLRQELAEAKKAGEPAKAIAQLQDQISGLVTKQGEMLQELQELRKASPLKQSARKGESGELDDPPDPKPGDPPADPPQGPKKTVADEAGWI